MSATGTADPPRITACVLLLAVALYGCAPGNIPTAHPASPQVTAAARYECASGVLEAEGSSAQLTAMDRWRSVYQRNCLGATIGYDPTGSGEGIKAFIAGKADFAGSDTPLSQEEQRSADKRCGAGPAIHLPTAVGLIAIAYQVPGLYSLKLGPVSLAKIFSGAATRWDDPAIRADNPGGRLPATPIHTVHRSDSSGTTDNFTAFLAAAAPGEWTFGQGKDWRAPGGTGADGSSGVARAVRDGEGTIGYIELSSAQDAALRVAGIDSGSGRSHQPTPEGAARTIAAAKVQSKGNDVRLEVTYAGLSAAAYPIVLVTYEIVCQKGLESGKAALARGFLSYATSLLGQRELPAVGYAELPEPLRGQVASAVTSIG